MSRPTVCDHLRESDSIIRSGGEEFIILMPSTDASAATACCERIRRAVNTRVWSSVADGLIVSTSLGVATTEDQHDLEAVIRLADQRLYEAKRTGRDRVVCGRSAALGAEHDRVRPLAGIPATLVEPLRPRRLRHRPPALWRPFR